MPLVLPDGTLLAENGLDRKEKLVSRIDPEMLKYMPYSEAWTPEAVKAAYCFLRDEWLCDVQTDEEGKAILIASAMSILERVAVSARPHGLRYSWSARRRQNHHSGDDYLRRLQA